MADPIGNEIPSPSAVRLPGLGAPELSVDYLRKLQEIVESLLGRRGSTWDRAVTFRDLQAGGLGGFIPGAGFAVPALFNPGSGTITTPGGAFDIDAAIRESAAYKDLLTKIGSAEELANLPEQIRRQLEEALIDVARENGAAIRQSENKLHNEQVSLAWRLDEITASLNTAAAGVREYNAAFADDVRAVATRVEQVAADLAAGGGGVEVQEQLTAISDAVDGLKGQWSLKIQTNPTSGQPPVIAGIALSVEDPIAGPGTSTLVFLSEKVGFYTENGTLNPFSIVGNMVTMTNVRARSLRVEADDGSVILDARPLAQQVASNPNLVPSPLGWPTFWGGGYAIRNTNTVFNNGEFIGLAPLATAGAYVSAESPPCGLPAGATVTVSFDASCDSGTRLLNVNFTGLNLDTAVFQQTLTTTFKRYVWTVTLPNSVDSPNAWLRMWTTAAGAQIIISNIKVEQGGKATGWEDSIITATNAKNRVFIPNLAALSAFFGNIEIGAGGALRQGQTAYDNGIGLFLGAKANGSAALSMATNNGAKFLCDPENNVLKMVKAEIDGLTMPAFTATLSGPGFNSNGGNGTRVLGSRQITGNGGELPYRSISWTITDLEGNSAARTILSGDTTDTVTVTASGTNAVTNVRIRGTITDAIGRTASASFSSIASFGTV